MTRVPRGLFVFLFSLTVIGSSYAQQAQPVEMAGLRPNPELHWQRTSPTAQQTDGPVLYQLVFTPGTTGTIAKFDSNTRHLVNSDITDVGSVVAIGNSGFTINANTGVVTFVNAQTFPGTVTSVSNTDGLVSITSPTTTPIINLNTTNTDARYVLKAGDTMTGTLTLPLNGLVGGSNQLVLSGGKVGIGTNGPNTQLQVVGAAGRSVFGGGTGGAGDAGLNAQGGAGGSVSGGLGPGGAGGSPTIAGGVGGTTFNGTGGAGGSITMTGGAGGSITATAGGFTAGAGGSITLAAGAGGTAGVGNNPGVGGNVLIEPGSGTPSGNVLVTTGAVLDSAGNDNGTMSNGGANNANLLLFGAGNTGEGIGSQRASNGGSNGNNQDGLDFYTNYTNRMSITNSGNVVMDPTGLNNGNLALGSAGPVLLFGGSGSGEGIGSNRTGDNDPGGKDGLNFYTNFTRRMIVDNTGRVFLDNGNIYLNSNREVKTAFTALQPIEVLRKLLAVPVQSWQYRFESAGIRHIGPMAQDFFAAFAVGPDNLHISPIDEGGVALAAIQGLNQKLEEQLRGKDARIAALEQEKDAQQKQMAAMQQQMNAVMLRLKTMEKSITASQIKK